MCACMNMYTRARAHTHTHTHTHTHAHTHAQGLGDALPPDIPRAGKPLSSSRKIPRVQELRELEQADGLLHESMCPLYLMSILSILGICVCVCVCVRARAS